MKPTYREIPLSAIKAGETASGPPFVPVVASFGRTDVGRHRKENEDAFFRDDALRLYVVADGMGGHAAGEVASQEAVEAVYGMVKRGLAGLGDAKEPLTGERARAACRLVEGAIQAATYMVFALSEIEHDKNGMGTTITTALVIGTSLIIGQVGDSRIYRIRCGAAEQMTEDHTLIAWQIKQGIISPAEAKISPFRNVITRAVGNHDYVEVDTSITEVQPGDRYLLCSDGLHGYVGEEEIPAIAELGGDAAIDTFIQTANDRGGRDNITAVMVEISSEPSAA